VENNATFADLANDKSSPARGRLAQVRKNWIFALVDATFGFADPGIRIRFDDKSLAKDVTFTSYLSPPLASRPPVN
jgi:hypothetical protein